MKILGLWMLLLSCLVAGCYPAPVPQASLTSVPPTPVPLSETPTGYPTRLPSETPTTVSIQPTAGIASATPSPSPSVTPTVLAPLTFAVLGDYGMHNEAEAAVASLILGWQPDLILTTGDNNYPRGSASTLDENVGQYFHAFISPYSGEYGQGADTNRFFPSIGNHDWMSKQGQPYLDYFTLPGNERYYDFTWGAVHFFVLNNESNEPDGVGSRSIQAQWLQERLAASTSPWQVVTMHYPAYSSGMHGSTNWAQWPYAAWGADAVLAGHDHTYERLIVDGIPYFVVGLGGGAIYSFVSVVPQSVMRYNATFGALWGEASQNKLAFRFITIDGATIDIFEIVK